jgi:hypothetical protein
MDNAEQYLLQVLRRTQTGLEDTLIPVHAEKCNRLIDRIVQSPWPQVEIDRLKTVGGFLRAALCMEWIMRRVEVTGEEFSLEQLDQDITTLNDRLFESFLSEPFDAPQAQSESSGAAAEQHPVAVVEPLTEDQYFAPIIDTAFEMDAKPGLANILDQNMLLGFQRFAETIDTFIEKEPAERKRTVSVLGMIARSSSDVAHAQGKTDLQNFFDVFGAFVKYVEDKDLSRNDDVAVVMVDVGDRLKHALQEPRNGEVYLRHLTTMLKNPSSLIH